MFNSKQNFINFFFLKKSQKLNIINFNFFYKNNQSFFNFFYNYCLNKNNFIILDNNYNSLYPVYKHLYGYNFLYLYKSFFFVDSKNFILKNWLFFFLKFCKFNKINLLFVFDYDYYINFYKNLSDSNICTSALIPYSYTYDYIDYPLFSFNITIYTKMLYSSYILYIYTLSFNFNKFIFQYKYILFFSKFNLI